MRVSSDFRVTIPKALRDKYGMHPGTAVEMFLTPEGHTAIRRIGPPAPTPSRKKTRKALPKKAKTRG